jgi:hypothetical protein
MTAEAGSRSPDVCALLSWLSSKSRYPMTRACYAVRARSQPRLMSRQTYGSRVSTTERIPWQRFLGRRGLTGCNSYELRASHRTSAGAKNPPKRAFLRADERARTLDLLHGKRVVDWVERAPETASVSGHRRSPPRLRALLRFMQFPVVSGGFGQRTQVVPNPDPESDPTTAAASCEAVEVSFRTKTLRADRGVTMPAWDCSASASTFATFARSMTSTT